MELPEDVPIEECENCQATGAVKLPLGAVAICPVCEGACFVPHVCEGETHTGDSD